MADIKLKVEKDRVLISHMDGDLVAYNDSPHTAWFFNKDGEVVRISSNIGREEIKLSDVICKRSLCDHRIEKNKDYTRKNFCNTKDIKNEDC
jgi:hypothetical protein